MASRGNHHIRRGRRTAAGAAVTAVTTALGLAVGAAAPAQAAGGWVPKDHALPWLPTTAVDGEISVTQVGTTATPVMKSFLRTGTEVTYATTGRGLQHIWGPAGDVVAVQPVDDTVASVVSGSTKEHLTFKTSATPVQWSPYGDTMVRNGGTASGGQQVATWIGSGRSENLTTGTAKDSNAATVTPDGWSALVTVPSPDVAGKRDLGVFDTHFPRYGNTAITTDANAPLALGYGALDARQPAVGADGTLAFVGTGDKGVALFVDEGQGPVAVRALGADCAGQRPAFAPSGRAVAVLVASPDCSSTELHVLDQVNGSFVAAQDTLVASSPAGTHFEAASWRAKTPAAHTARLGGKDRIATGIATSKWGWTEGSPDGALLASSASFADAVVGGPLSAQFQIPLLLNGPKTLDSRVLTELKRLMPNPEDRYVSIVGGTGVMSSAVEKSLKANGFGVQRIAGADRFATSVAAAKVLDAGWQGGMYPRTSAFLADGMNFPDALAAGPAASGFFAPVLLTKGTSVPSVVSTYIKGRSNITDVYGVGGNAAKASRALGGERTHQVFGKDRYETSVQVARTFFPGGSYVGYASGQSFPDALTGGSLMGALIEPLLLVKGSEVPTLVRVQAERYRAGTDLVLVFGGTGAVSNGVKATVSSLAGRQTALWGGDSPWEGNPDFPQTLGARGPAQSAPVGDVRTAPGTDRPSTPRDLRAASQG